MKKLFLSVLAIAGLVACSTEDVVRVQDRAEISFEGAFVENTTRANDPSTTTGNIDKFYVWAVMDNETGIVFDDEEVRKSGSQWSYTETQYWTPDHLYYFSAIAGDRSDDQIVLDLAAESKLGMSVDGLGTATFTNVNGTNDFLYAEYEYTTPESVTTVPAPVKFQFDHLLSKVKFTFENGFINQNNTIVVKNVKMVVPKVGSIDLTQNAYDWNDTLTGTTTLLMGDMAEGANVAIGQSASSDYERFTIPAPATQEYTVTFDVELWMGQVCASTANKTVTISGIEFLPGRAYNFKAEINHQNVDENPLYDIVFNVEVEEWDEEVYDGGAVEDEVIVLNEVVTNADEMAAALKSDANIITVKMDSDIDLPISELGQITGGSGEYKLGGEDTASITIDLNGHKLNITTTYWSVLGAKNADAIFTIKNGTMTSSQLTGTWNSYDLGFANCNYNFENVVFEKAIALEAANKTYNLNNVTINETHDYYAMWISAKGQTVNIDGLTINSAGRGIKIDEQYVGAPAKVTMNVANATFATVKKAAVIVKSVAGAEINWGVGNSISGVAEDNEFAVWVDEDAAANADEVVVNGALCKVEGSRDDAVATSDELAAAVNAGAKKVFLMNGTYTLASYPAGLELVGCGDDVVLDVQGKAYGVYGDVTIENVKLVFSNANYTGFQHTNVEYYKNCTIVGQPFLYGNDVTFEGCTFEQTSANAYNVWTYGAKAVKFIDCEFNCAGKSVLIYAESSSNGQVALFEGCTLNASAPAEGKAAIEIDSSLIKGVYDITINDTTATGFANGNVSGNSLWNNKKGDKATITVDGVKVL